MLASYTTANAVLGEPASWFSRSRRMMFSTSMMASSTTSPRAMMRPASTIVSMVLPE